MEEIKRVGFTRRALLTAAVGGGAGFAGPTLVSPLNANVSDDAVKLIKQLTGKIPTESDRLHLAMPRVFPNGFTVPLSLEVDTPMTETDHVRYARVLAPRNPSRAMQHSAAARISWRFSSCFTGSRVRMSRICKLDYSLYQYLTG